MLVCFSHQFCCFTSVKSVADVLLILCNTVVNNHASLSISEGAEFDPTSGPAVHITENIQKTILEYT